MAEVSLPWPDQTPDVNDGRPYTADEHALCYRNLFTKTGTANEGVLAGALNELAVTAPAANTIRVNTGAAVVYGRLYYNTASLDLTPASAPGGQTRKDYAILRADWTGGAGDQYAVRAEVKAGTAVAFPSLTQVAGTCYEIPIASYTINDAGAISDLTIEGVRLWCHFNTMVDGDMIDDGAVDTDQLAADAVDGTKIADDAVDTEHIAAGAVTPTEMTAYSLHAFVWFIGGEAATGVNPTGLKYQLMGDETFTEWKMVATTGPTGADLIVDINKDGVTLFTVQADRPKIASGNSEGSGGAPAVTSGLEDTTLSLDIDQIGSGDAGADVTVMLFFKRPLIS